MHLLNHFFFHMETLLHNLQGNVTLHSDFMDASVMLHLAGLGLCNAAAVVSLAWTSFFIFGKCMLHLITYIMIMSRHHQTLANCRPTMQQHAVTHGHQSWECSAAIRPG